MRHCSESSNAVQSFCKRSSPAGNGNVSCCHACKQTDGRKHGVRCESEFRRRDAPSRQANEPPVCAILTAKSQSPSRNSLPLELLLRLPAYLEHPKDFCRSASVCQDWKSLGGDEETWQRLCNEWYPAMVAKVACTGHVCIVFGCGRRGGYPTCCRGCEVSQGETHGSQCGASSAVEKDWRELFQARYIRQQAWESVKRESESLKKDRAVRERQQSIQQDKQRGQNFRGQENGQRSVRNKTCRRCGVGYLPKDNVDLACTYHPGRLELRRPAGEGLHTIVEQFTGTQVQKAFLSLRRKSKKFEPGSKSSHVQLLMECGMNLINVW